MPFEVNDKKIVMEQMNTSGLDVITVDYTSADLSAEVRLLKPALYKDGDAVCCIFGPDPQEGIFGCGHSPEEALQDWENHLKDRLINHPYGDPVAESVIHMLDRLKEGQ